MNGQDTLKNLLEISSLIQKETDHVSIVSRVIDIAREACNAEGCFFFTLNDDYFLSLDYTYNKTLEIDRKGSDNLSFFPTIFLPERKNKESKSLAEICALNGELISTKNIYLETDKDISFFETFYKDNSYRTISVLTIPVYSRRDVVIGVAQFINAEDSGGQVTAFSPEVIETTRSVCNLAGLILENRSLREAYVQLLESFIEVIARAIDAKSPYTGAHCQRVPVITRLLATAAVQQEEGPLKEFEMSTQDWYNLHIASWLHDCGKVTTPEYIVDKATKLETINNRIHEIRNRFEIMRRDAHIEYLKKRLNSADTQENLQAEFINKIKQLEDDFDFIAKCNIGDKGLSDKDIARVESISKLQFTRYFSRLKGLSWAERDNIKNKELYDKPSIENLLQNREDHIFNNYNNGELYNLQIRNGTINKEEREKINEHIVVTIDMLKALPFPKELSNVVEYAGAHHERIDGRGYPNNLTGDQMSIPAKIMAIADIFEALTANDRPYKEPKKLSEVLSIMKHMKNTGHIDSDLYEVFIKNKVYMDYVEQYVSPEQIDDINPENYL
ncbi:MAG: HD domain-containing protein [Lactobacillus sp.]|jgi:HD-GYP domain-containing protein (c-di-GMP phosphodiesterase class II)|nr:HD domain-containing protein [Lactobacillus sp.]